MDAEMLYHKDAVFWLNNFKSVHSPPLTRWGLFPSKVCSGGVWYHYFPQRRLIAAQH